LLVNCDKLHHKILNKDNINKRTYSDDYDENDDKISLTSSPNQFDTITLTTNTLNINNNNNNNVVYRRRKMSSSNSTTIDDYNDLKLFSTSTPSYHYDIFNDDNKYLPLSTENNNKNNDNNEENDGSFKTKLDELLDELSDLVTRDFIMTWLTDLTYDKSSIFMK
jgi:hypothetical protein